MAAGGGPQLRYSEACCDLTVCTDTNNSAAISADVRWVASSSRTTEVVYRRALRLVITTGAEIMDQIFQPKQRRGVT